MTAKVGEKDGREESAEATRISVSIISGDTIHSISTATTTTTTGADVT